MAEVPSRFMSFHSDGSPAGLGDKGDYPFTFKSTLLLRYALVDGKIVDKFSDLSDEEALQEVVEQGEKRAREQTEVAATAEAGRPYELYKTDVVAAMNDEELDAFDTQLAKATTRERRMWADCTRLVSTEPYFDALLAGFKAAFGEERGAALLARR